MEMIIQYPTYESKVRKIYTCPCREHFQVSLAPKIMTIKEYYSEKEAMDNGWRRTNDIMFCEPDKKFVWICPKCAKKIEWKEGN